MKSKLLYLFLLAFLIGWFYRFGKAQTTSTLAINGLPPSTRGGQTVNGVITLTDATQAPAATQFTIVTSADVASITITVGTVAATAMKQAPCGTYAGAQLTCLTYGLNMTSIQSGQLATFTATVVPKPVGTAIPFSLSGQVESDPSGGAIATTVNPAQAVTVLSNCDLNGDGVTNAADATVMQNIILGPTSGNPLHYDVTALQKVVNAALGGACTL